MTLKFISGINSVIMLAMIKKIVKSLREFKRDAILTVLCMVVEAGMEIMIPFSSLEHNVK